MTKTNKAFKFITVEIIWSSDDEGYIARPIGRYTNFSGFGLTRGEAVKELEIAMEGL